MAALGHVTAGDEVLKNSSGNLPFENYKIPAYTTLLTAARASGERSAVGPLEQSLDEERGMAGSVSEHIAAVIEKFTSLQGSGETAKI